MSANTESDGNEILLTRSKDLIPRKAKMVTSMLGKKSGKGPAPFFSAVVAAVGKGALRSNALLEKKICEAWCLLIAVSTLSSSSMFDASCDKLYATSSMINSLKLVFSL